MLRRKFLNSNDIRSSESVTPVVLYWGKKKKNQRKNKYDRGDDGRAVCSMTFIDFPSADILFVALKALTRFECSLLSLVNVTDVSQPVIEGTIEKQTLGIFEGDPRPGLDCVTNVYFGCVPI